MNLLDENFPLEQRIHLRKLGVRFREVGTDTGVLGAQDPDIIRLLHRSSNVTFFTLDEDHFRKSWVHSNYCLVWLDVQQDDAPCFVRQFLKHPDIKSKAKRMGTVVRVTLEAIYYWRQKPASLLKRISWSEN